ncbi:MAG: HPF/RaiA family ribosome-associated protein [Bdellovibrionales bacterium]
MQIETGYMHIELSPTLSDFVEKRLQTLVRRYRDWGDGLIIRLHVDLVNRKASGAPRLFEVMAEVIRPKSKPLVVRKRNKDLRQAVTAGVESLEKLVRRESEKRERSRKTVGRSLKSVQQARWEVSVSRMHVEPGAQEQAEAVM